MVAVARDGELADPRVPAPPGLRPVLGFSRFSSTAYAVIRKAVDEDDDLRARAAAVADEAEVGRAGWLWLTRPDGWEDDPVFGAGEGDREHGQGLARLRRERDGAKAAALRHQQAASRAEVARRRAEDQLADAVRLGRAEVAAESAAEAAALRGDLSRLEEERNAAVRAQKRLEGELAESRRDLKAARAALVSAEAELAVARGAPPPLPVPPTDPFDRSAARAAVDEASRAAAEVARALTEVAASLGVTPSAPTADRSAAAGAASGVARRTSGRRTRGRSANRVRPQLPPGLFEHAPEAQRHLVAAGEALLVVDGYNVARTAWPGLSPEEERRRTVALLEEVRARSGGEVVVVFDGDDSAFAPSASRSVRVQFSASGVTADEAIAELLGNLPANRPVVVVSSDREVADDARRAGAVTLGARDFLVAAGR